MTHFSMSLIKSVVRILSCILGIIFTALLNIEIGFKIAVSGLLTAEILGILEEVFDKRKEK